MEFLGIGPLELLFVILIAILVIGPRDIGKTARTVGQVLNRLYKSEAWKTLLVASNEVRNLPNRLAKEAELEELKELTRVHVALTPGSSPDVEDRAGRGESVPAAERPDSGEEGTEPSLAAWVRPATSASDGSEPGQTNRDPARPSPT